MALISGCVEKCPACAHRHMSRDESHAVKEAWLHRRLSHWADVLCALRGPHESKRLYYRRKVSLSAQWSGRVWEFGVWNRREFIAIPQCPVHSPDVNAICRLLSVHLPPASQFPLAFYVQSGAQCTLVVKIANMPDMHWLTDELREKLLDCGLEGLWLNLHPSAGKRIFAKAGWHLVAGMPRSLSALGLTHGPASFQQLIAPLYMESLNEAVSFFSLAPGDAVVDLYSGIGASVRQWLRAGARVLAVESGGEAVECCQTNNPGVEVLRGRCALRLPQVEQWIDKHVCDNQSFCLYVNPPRTGLEPEITQWITGISRPAKIAYLSCSAGTLNRDLTVLCAHGYRVEQIIPFDFFPQTFHVETLVKISL